VVVPELGKRSTAPDFDYDQREGRVDAKHGLPLRQQLPVIGVRKFGGTTPFDVREWRDLRSARRDEDGEDRGSTKRDAPVSQVCVAAR
jgi:hypothetical protein